MSVKWGQQEQRIEKKVVSKWTRNKRKLRSEHRAYKHTYTLRGGIFVGGATKRIRNFQSEWVKLNWWKFLIAAVWAGTLSTLILFLHLIYFILFNASISYFIWFDLILTSFLFFFWFIELYIFFVLFTYNLFISFNYIVIYFALFDFI